MKRAFSRHVHGWRAHLTGYHPLSYSSAKGQCTYSTITAAVLFLKKRDIGYRSCVFLLHPRGQILTFVHRCRESRKTWWKLIPCLLHSRKIKTTDANCTSTCSLTSAKVTLVCSSCASVQQCTKCQCASRESKGDTTAVHPYSKLTAADRRMMNTLLVRVSRVHSREQPKTRAFYTPNIYLHVGACPTIEVAHFR